MAPSGDSRDFGLENFFVIKTVSGNQNTELSNTVQVEHTIAIQQLWHLSSMLIVVLARKKVYETKL